MRKTTIKSPLFPLPDVVKWESRIEDEVVTADLAVLLHGQPATALADIGADFSIISQVLAVRLKKVQTPWTGLHIKTAGGQLLMLTGRCAARIDIGGSSFVATLVILAACCKDLITGIDFLREYGAVINIPDRVVIFEKSPDFVHCSEPRHDPLRLTDAGVVIPPR